MPKSNKNIHKIDGRYIVEKNHNGKRYTFGSYPTLKDARYIRDHLEVVNYGFNLQDDMKYISYSTKKNSYRVRKIIGNKCVFDKYYKDLNEAKKVRDFLLHNNWNVAYLNNSSAEENIPIYKYQDIIIEQLNNGKCILKEKGSEKIIKESSSILSAIIIKKELLKVK